MAARKSISASLRWTVFARDGFTCRYCGKQAGQDGVDLAVDHVLSVADGGDNTIDNLVTACRKCNSGKGARSLKDAPTTAEVVERITERMANLQEQALALKAATKSAKARDAAAREIKEHAYGGGVDFESGEVGRIASLSQEFGPDIVLKWFECAESAGVEADRAIRYVHGCAKATRNERVIGPLIDAFFKENRMHFNNEAAERNFRRRCCHAGVEETKKILIAEREVAYANAKS